MRAFRFFALSFVVAAGCTATVTSTPVAQPAPAPGPTVVVAQGPEHHPAYLHALTDLRDARAHLERPAGGVVKWDEQKAVREIDAAINEIKRASVDDGKNINEHQPVDVALPWEGRLHKALDLVEKARADVNQEEDNGFANGLRNRAIGHIDGALRASSMKASWTPSTAWAARSSCSSSRRRCRRRRWSTRASIPRTSTR